MDETWQVEETSALFDVPHDGKVANWYGITVAGGAEDGRLVALVADVAGGRMARMIGHAPQLVAALAGLIEAVELDSKDKGISGFTGARLSDARAALTLATEPPTT